MHEGSPRQWPYASNNSPLPLPEHPVLFTKEAVLRLDRFTGAMTEQPLEGEALRAYLGSYGTGNGTLDELLQQAGAPSLRERRPILLQGELANPYRLQEMSHVGMASKEQLKRIREWLDNGVRSTWRPVKLGEGTVRFEHNPTLQPPSTSDVEWDGTTERVSLPMPEPTGPPVSLDELLVVVHTRQGCYNHRGRLSRCVHMHQRAFHEGLFRKGSSHRWDDILTLR
ncbi:MAG: hypothetical protein ACPG34_00660 [Poseidonia sp.]